MYTVYYGEKRIIFDFSEDKYNNFIHFSRTDTLSYRAEVLDLLDGHDHLACVCEDVERVFASFCDLFKRVTAAGGIVVDSRGRTLMIFRNGRWDLPKGKREPGESLEECAVREVHEECGISGHTCGRPVGTTWHLYVMNGEMILKDTYWFSMAYNGPTDLTPQTEEGISRAEWCTEKEKRRNLEGSYHTIRDLF